MTWFDDAKKTTLYVELFFKLHFFKISFLMFLLFFGKFLFLVNVVCVWEFLKNNKIN